MPELTAERTLRCSAVLVRMTRFNAVRQAHTASSKRRVEYYERWRMEVTRKIELAAVAVLVRVAARKGWKKST